MLERLMRQRGFWWSLFLGWWCLFVAVFTVTGYYARVARGDSAFWSEMLRIALIQNTLMALLAFAAFQLAWRLPLDRGRWRWTLPIHLVAGFALLVVRALVVYFLGRHVGWLSDLPLATRLQSVPAGIPMYASFVGAGYAISFYRRFRERELRTLQLEAGLARTQLQVLRMQLQPHFLFTTLRGISELMHRDVKAADRMLARLGDLLRLMLERRGSEEVALKEELEFIRLYLEIERMRLGEGRLEVDYRIEPEALEALVPHLILQPLVESAIRQGISPCVPAGRLEIAARRSHGKLQLEVHEQCASRTEVGRTRFGPAPELDTTRARLTQLYDGGHRLELRPSPEGGQVIAMTIPFHSPVAVSGA